MSTLNAIKDRDLTNIIQVGKSDYWKLPIGTSIFNILFQLKL